MCRDRHNEPGYFAYRFSQRVVHRLRGAVDDHPVAVEAPAQELVRRAPEVKPETPVVELAEPGHHRLAVRLEVPRPLPEGETAVVPVVVHLPESDGGGPPENV